HGQPTRELRPVVIAAIGAVTPLGDTFPATLAALNEAKSGISAAPLLSKLRRTAAAAGTVTAHVEPGSRSLALAHRAIAEAGGADPAVPLVWAPMWDGDPASLEFETSLTVEATCSGGIRALTEAARLVAMGECEEALAVAVVARNNPLYASQFAQLTALSQWDGEPAQASRPFDQDRSGMVLAEGAVTIRVRAGDTGVLLAGSGACHDYAHPTAPSVPAIVVAIEQALTEARLHATAVDSISTHGTGTRLNDAAEADALHHVFGERLTHIPATALKSSTGHASSASSLLEVAVLAETLCSGIVPPILNCPHPDVAINLAATSRHYPSSVGVSTSFGFGGQHAAIILYRQ
ncbi:MAG: beta-ketoacyl synthase N-terminal-like domain-containing protein, partial [Propionibacteriaceae bacterium]